MEDDDFERARKNRKVSFTGDDNDGLPDDYGIDDFGNEEFGNDPYGDDYGNETMGTPMGGGNEEGGLQADALFESSGLKKKKNVHQFDGPKMSNMQNMMRQLQRMSTSSSSSSSSSSSMSSVDEDAPTLAFSKVVASVQSR